MIGWMLLFIKLRNFRWKCSERPHKKGGALRKRCYTLHFFSGQPPAAAHALSSLTTIFKKTLSKKCQVDTWPNLGIHVVICLQELWTLKCITNQQTQQPSLKDRSEKDKG